MWFYSWMKLNRTATPAPMLWRRYQIPVPTTRLHHWPGKGTSMSDLPLSKRVVEMTSKMVQVPSRPALRQIEPGSQTGQPPPSAVFWLDPKGMHGFRFLTTSVAPSPIYDIIGFVYQYLKLLRQVSPPKWIYRELQDIANMDFTFA